LRDRFGLFFVQKMAVNQYPVNKAVKHWPVEETTAVQLLVATSNVTRLIKIRPILRPRQQRWQLKIALTRLFLTKYVT
jgi:hypothetical protein